MWEHLKGQGNDHDGLVGSKGISQDLHCFAVTHINEKGRGRSLKNVNLRRGINPDTLRGVQEDPKKSTLLQVRHGELMLVVVLSKKAACLLVN